MKRHRGHDGEYEITSKRRIEHIKKDGSRESYFSTLDIKDAIDRIDVERILKKSENGK